MILSVLLPAGLSSAWAQTPPVHDHSTMQGGSPPPGARDPHAYSGGLTMSPGHVHGSDGQNFGSVLIDRFERVHVRHGGNNTAYDLQARYGRDYDKFVLKAEGEVAGGEVHESRTEMLWSHAVAPYWDVQTGVRTDGGEGPGRRWFVAGVQGLAPYWFEIDSALYLDSDGRSLWRMEAEYELLLTQRLILQPRFELNVAGKEDNDNLRGKGLSDATFGLRLRYEIRREFAPYLGFERVARHGTTATLYRLSGRAVVETRFVAGLRFWF